MIQNVHRQPIDSDTKPPIIGPMTLRDRQCHDSLRGVATYWSQKRSHGEQRHCSPTLSRRDDVGDGSSANCQRARGSTSRKESKNEKHAGIFAQGTSNDEAYKNDIANVVDHKASVQFG